MWGGWVTAQYLATMTIDPESVPTTQKLLELLIFQILFLRQHFPRQYFTSVRVKHLDNLEMQVLSAEKDAEARRVVEWLEYGVAGVISKGWLDKLYFGFSLDPTGKDIIEEYIWSISYPVTDPGGGLVFADRLSLSTFDLSQSNRECSIGASSIGAASSMSPFSSVLRLIRALVNLCGSLDELPQHRFLFIKLSYTDHCPPGYEPPLFRPATARDVGAFPTPPLYARLGHIRTECLTLCADVKTTLDSLDSTECTSMSYLDEDDEDDEDDCGYGDQGYIPSLTNVPACLTP